MSRLETENPADVYSSLVNTEIIPLSDQSKIFEEISSSVYNTHSTEHSWYTLQVDSIYEIRKTLADFKFKPFEKLENR